MTHTTSNRFGPNRLALALAAAAIAATPAHAASSKVEVMQAWSRPAAAGASAAGFMTLRNPGPRADALVAVTSPRSGPVMIHQSRIASGMASMRMLDRVEVPAAGAVVFGPGGYHLMFTGLKSELKIGDRLPATLVFASGAKVRATFAVDIVPPRPGRN